MIANLTRKLLSFAMRRHAAALERVVERAYDDAEIADDQAEVMQAAATQASIVADRAVEHARNVFAAANEEAHKLGLKISPNIQ